MKKQNMVPTTPKNNRKSAPKAQPITLEIPCTGEFKARLERGAKRLKITPEDLIRRATYLQLAVWENRQTQPKRVAQKPESTPAPLTQAEIEACIGTQMQTFPCQHIGADATMLELLVEVEGLQLFRDEVGRYVVDREVSHEVHATRKDEPVEYSFQHARHQVTPKKAIYFLMLHALPEELFNDADVQKFTRELI